MELKCLFLRFMSDNRGNMPSKGSLNCPLCMRDILVKSIPNPPALYFKSLLQFDRLQGAVWSGPVSVLLIEHFLITQPDNSAAPVFELK